MSLQNATDDRRRAMNRRKDFAALHRVLDDAAFVLNLSDAVCATAHALISGIPAGAPAPASPVSIKTLAQKRNKDPRTIPVEILSWNKPAAAANKPGQEPRDHVEPDRDVGTHRPSAARHPAACAAPSSQNMG